MFEYSHFIEVPPKNCYLDKDRIRADIAAWSKRKARRVSRFSASMAANVIIHELFPAMGATSWLIDFGSLWDCYVGVDSRGGKSKKYWDVLINQNIGCSKMNAMKDGALKKNAQPVKDGSFIDYCGI